MNRLAPVCIYTLKDSRVLSREAKSDGSGELLEKRPWKTGRHLFIEALNAHDTLPIIFSAAETEVSVGLIWWARVRRLEVENGETRCAYDSLAAIEPALPISSLVVRSTGRPLPESDIRPYRICMTPDFLNPVE